MARVTIRALTLADRDAAVEVINRAARWYRGFLPPEEVHDPEMTATQWDEEARRLYAHAAALLRHAYILPEHQHRGIGHRLEKMGYRLSTDPAAVLREYCVIPEDRLRASVTYEKPA